jgi:hypothetical protein
MKKILAVLIFTTTFISIHAQKTFTADGIAYSITSDNTVMVTSGKTKLASGGTYTGDITIPSKVNYLGAAYSVTSIDSYAFSSCSGLTSIHIPSGVSTIGETAFSGCNGFTSIILPDSLTSISESAFEMCSKLKSITIPPKVESIGIMAFSGCEALRAIEFPASVNEINKYAFALCELESIKVYTNPPPYLNDDPFIGIDTSIPVYVPASALEIYKEDSEWKKFTNIRAMSDKN